MLLLAHALIAGVVAAVPPPKPLDVEPVSVDVGAITHEVVLGQLQAIADARFPDPKFRPRVTGEDGVIFRWHMECRDDRGDLVGRVIEGGADATVDRTIMLRAWANDLNRQLVDLTTETVEQSGVDPEFNPETDVRFRVLGLVSSIDPHSGSATAERSLFHAAYVGSARTWLSDSSHNANHDPIPTPNGGELRIGIVTDRERWHVGEPITGRIVLTNTGDSRVPVPVRWSEMIRAVGADGTEPEAFAFEGCILYGNSGPRNDFVAAGDSREESFRLLTAPKDDFDSGQYLTVGIWMLELSGTLCENVEQIATPASVLVVPN